MSGGAEILKEYLIECGFHVNENQLRSLNSRLADVNKMILTVGVSIAGMATAVGAAVIGVSEHLEDLHYASQRMRTSVKDLREWEIAAHRIGLTTEQSRGQLEALSDAINASPNRQNPILLGFGIDTAKIKDVTEVYRQFVEVLDKTYGHEGGFFASQKFLEGLGLDDKYALRIMQNLRQLDEARLDARKTVEKNGRDADADAEKAALLMGKVRNLQDQIASLENSVLARIADHYGPQIQRLAEYIDAHFEEIAQRADHFLGELDQVITKANEVAKAFGGWKEVLKDIFIYLTITRVGGIVASLLNVIALMRLAKLIPAGVTAAEVAAGAAGAAETAAVVAPVAPLVPTAVVSTGVLLLADKVARAVTEKANTRDPGDGLTYDPRHNGWKLGDKASGILSELQEFGWSKANAAGILGNLIQENPDFDPHKTGDGGHAYGIGQWHEDRQEDFKRVFGHDIRQSNLHEQLQFINWELHQKMYQKAFNLLKQHENNARASGGDVSEYYLKPKKVIEEIIHRGQLADNVYRASEAGGRLGMDGSVSKSTTINQTVNQTNHTNVNGAQNPEAVGHLVKESMKRSMSDIHRNFKKVLT